MTRWQALSLGMYTECRYRVKDDRLQIRPCTPYIFLYKARTLSRAARSSIGAQVHSPAELRGKPSTCPHGAVQVSRFSTARAAERLAGLKRKRLSVDEDEAAETEGQEEAARKVCCTLLGKGTTTR